MEHLVKQKYAQMVRVYRRLAIININTGDKSLNEEARDAAEEFFNQCYHLKDYCKKDKSINLSVDIEEYITKNPHLSLAADYCNTFKHGGLDNKPRLGKNIDRISTHMFVLQPNQIGLQNFTRLEIEIGGKSFDVFAIASKCLEAWNKYLKINGYQDIIDSVR